MKKLSYILLLTSFIFSQGKKYEGPDDPAGDIAAEREGYMTGNRVFLYFRNNTELSDWPKVNVSRWPNNLDGVKMVDGIGLLVGAKIYIKDDPTTKIDSTVVSDPLEIGDGEGLHKLYFLQTSYREEMDVNPAGTFEYGFYPAFGYSNETSEYPAMSNRPSSWPPDGWPSTGTSTKWPGEWDGRFGRGVIYADMETYFVANDAQDQEYLELPDRVRYYPRGNKKIGEIRDNVTIGKNNPWGGLGLRVEARGFQWNNPQARDAIFWEYNIANISDYDLTEVAFGYWVDNAIGNDGNDELAYFNTDLDLSYSWDINGIGSGGFPTGTMGFAFLESPGMAYDNIDNDNDGILDEKRDNIATTKVGPTDGIYDVDKFLSFFKVDLAELKEHWDADEDQDWQDGEDLNNDGVYQITEYFGDDIGLDGVAPTELNYTGPDEGEGNHKPDYVEGVGSEPNFAVTDVSESDMIGLTAFRLFPVPSHAQSNSTWWFKNDEAMWELIGENILEEYMDQISNLIEVFASGPFPLYKGRTERISMSELHSYDPLEGLNSPAHTAPALYELKKIVQVIYEKDYRFAQPPKMPTLTATPADGKVILTWDNISDTRTRDPFLGNINDFEGYKLFRATDKYFADAEVITDGYGTPMFMKPIFQCDLKDGKFGFTDFGLVNGVGYNLGSDTGISHVFVDNTVMNGRTYYYGLVAYDYGAPHIGPGISPSENNVVVELDEAEEVRSIGKNVAIVTPFKPAAGYVAPDITIDDSNLPGGGEIEPSILAQSSIKKDHQYQVTFDIDTIALLPQYDYGLMYTTNSIMVTDLSEGTIIYKETPLKFVGSNLIKVDSLGYWTLNTKAPFSTDIFDGIQLNVDLPFEQGSYDYANSGWVQGSGIMRVVPTIRESSYLPWDYHIIFSSDPSVYTSTTSIKTGIRDAVDDRIPTNEILLGQSFGFYVKNETLLKPDGSHVLMDMVVHDVNKNGVFDKSEDKIIVGGMRNDGKWAGTAFVIDFNLTSTATYPKSDDIFRVKFSRPFWKDDYLTFTINSYDDIDADSLAKTMDNIRVVPNPYVATNVMETAVSNQFLNQRRSLMFTNVPAQALIKIFTISGVLVDEIVINNSPEKGVVHWDMLTREGLEIAAGMYLFHIEALATGDQKIGKFAVIK
ncbi:MAG: hypothetical protein HN367_11300 [Candidatus Marinimicrobia bacterium]|nr:hypothetical protein [Candidatus Neomarinimicrobiota bacterium]